ncbi:MAG TPA: hypothetical protein VG184_03810 [Acidimicrobiales bacterium]|nr:hypothetical protein [Acidimicrobiales bacterium]
MPAGALPATVAGGRPGGVVAVRLAVVVVGRPGGVAALRAGALGAPAGATARGPTVERDDDGRLQADGAELPRLLVCLAVSR